MKRFIPICLLICFISTRLPAQLVTGTVLDANTKTVLAHCSIRLTANGITTGTDNRGHFNLNLPGNGSYTMIVSYTGYLPDTLCIETGKEYQVLLKPQIGLLTDVVVTGVSKATSIKENPVAVATVQPRQLEKTISSNVMDALVRNVPGLNAVKTGPNISKPFIRGLGYNRVLTLYDGVRQEGQQWGDEHGIEVDAYSIEKAEVIKGPASLMFGSDAVAGVVSMFPWIPKANEGKISGQFTSEYQSNNRLSGNGFRLGSAGKHWLWALRGSYRIAKNYRNSIDGPVYNTGFSEKNASLLLGHTSAAGFSHLNFTLYDNLQGIPDGSRDSLTRNFTKQIAEGLADDIKGRPVVNDHELNSYKLSPLHQRIQHYRIYTNNRYKLNNSTLEAQLAFQQNNRREYTHPTMPQQPGLSVRLNTINYGVKFTAPEFNNIELTGGINGMYQQNSSRNATDFPIPDYKLFDIGGFVYARWKYDRLVISGGLRYDHRNLHTHDFYVRTNAATGFDAKVVLPDTAGATLQFPALQKNYSGVSLSIGGTYRLSDNIYAKFNLARGYRAPNITEIGSNGLDPGAHIIYLGNRSFTPEFSFQQDLGISMQYTDFTASASLFHNSLQGYIYLTQLADAQGNPVLDPQGNRTFQYQQSSAVLYGFEASLDLNPSLLYGFTLGNQLAVVYGRNKHEQYSDKGIEGEYLPLLPPLKLLSNLGRNFPVGKGIVQTISADASVELNAAQNRYLALYNTETATPAYTLFNLSSGIDLRFSTAVTVRLLFQVNNLFDVAYQSHLSRLKYFEYYAQSPDGRSGIYGMGRNFCIRLSVPVNP
jgi:iron complex outermembrane recepter protein